MKRFLSVFFLMYCTLSLAQVTTPSSASASPDDVAYSYVKQLDGIASMCAMYNGFAMQANSMPNGEALWKEYSDKESACVREGMPKAEAIFREAMAKPNRPAVKTAMKRVYARWLTYMDSYDKPSGHAAKQAFDDAGNDLHIEVMTP